MLLSDLELLRGLLTTLYNQHEAQDLVDNYRKLDNRLRLSALTRAIGDSLAKVEAYIEQAEDEPEEPSDD